VWAFLALRRREARGWVQVQTVAAEQLSLELLAKAAKLEFHFRKTLQLIAVEANSQSLARTIIRNEVFERCAGADRRGSRIEDCAFECFSA
jgi:hypothetical protein